MYIENNPTAKKIFADQVNIWLDSGIEPETSNTAVAYATNVPPWQLTLFISSSSLALSTDSL